MSSKRRVDYLTGSPEFHFVCDYLLDLYMLFLAERFNPSRLCVAPDSTVASALCQRSGSCSFSAIVTDKKKEYSEPFYYYSLWRVAFGLCYVWPRVNI